MQTVDKISFYSLTESPVPAPFFANTMTIPYYSCWKADISPSNSHTTTYYIQADKQKKTHKPLKTANINAAFWWGR